MQMKLFPSIKKYITISTLIFLIGIGTAHRAMAVDGYKNLKFGMTKKQVIDSGICKFRTSAPIGNGIEYMDCTDFEFGGDHVGAGAYMVNDIFLRFAIMLPIEKYQSITEAVINKYGSPSSMSSEEELKAIDKFPNREAFVAFDKDTVYLKLSSNGIGVPSIILIYTSPKYDAHLFESQRQSVKDDI